MLWKSRCRETKRVCRCWKVIQPYAGHFQEGGNPPDVVHPSKNFIAAEIIAAKILIMQTYFILGQMYPLYGPTSQVWHLSKGSTMLSNTSIVKCICKRVNFKNYLHLWPKQLFAHQMFVIFIYYGSVWLAYAVAICPDKLIVGVEHQLKVKTGCLGIG